jgi:hypothetical protein
MSIPNILAAMKRVVLLDLSEGFAYDGVRRRVEERDQTDYRRWTVTQFSGTLCIDELHQKSSRQRRGSTLQDKSHFIFQHRHLIVTNEDNLSQTQQELLRTMFEYLPALRILREGPVRNLVSASEIW